MYQSLLNQLCVPVLFFATPLFAVTKNIKSHFVYYENWDSTMIPILQKYDLVSLQPGSYMPDSDEANGIAKLKSKGTLVLLYVTIGEDDRTYNNLPAIKGDGKGPSYWNNTTNSIVNENKGVASYYLDEWNTKGADSAIVNKVHDGIPDRQGDWGSCLVNAGDPLWQNQVMTTVTALMDEGADGLLLDTPETADPWHGYGWTAPGMYSLIKKIHETYPDKFLLLNRGLFFFEPVFAYHYQWNPRKFINGVLFESYYSDSDYLTTSGGNGSTHINPFFEKNKFTTAPALNADLSRPDSYGPILGIDYTNDAKNISITDPVFFQKSLQEMALIQGWLPEFTDRTLSNVNTAAIDATVSVDKSAPTWQNTSLGFVDLISPKPPFYMAMGNEHSTEDLKANPPEPRVGLLKAIPGNGQVILRWDVAADQTRPVRYNVYYQKDGPINFDTSPVIANVQTTFSGDYTIRGLIDADDACPFEYTVTGLTNQSLYRFAVRAEDGTVGVTAPSSGRSGPNNGIEETNTEILMAIPQDSSNPAINIDGEFSDWDKITGYVDSVGDGTEVDFSQFKIVDDSAFHYLYVETNSDIDVSKFSIYFNSDVRSFTGDTTKIGSGFRGADYKWSAGKIFKFTAKAWKDLNLTTTFQNLGHKVEIKIDKKTIGGDLGPGMKVILATLTGTETLPDHGVSGISYTYSHPLSKTDLLGIVKKTSAPNQRQFLTFNFTGAQQQFFFNNPEHSATFLIHTLNGELVHRWDHVQEGVVNWMGTGISSRLVTVTIVALGLPATSQLILLQ